MDDSEKIRRLVEDYQKAQRVLDGLNGRCKDIEKSDEYLLGRKILSSWWLLCFIGINCYIGEGHDEIHTYFKSYNHRGYLTRQE